MLVMNKGADREVTLRVVLESAEFGREYFDDYDSMKEIIAAVMRLAQSSAEETATDGVVRVVGIAIVPKEEYGSDSGYGFGLDDDEEEDEDDE